MSNHTTIKTTNKVLVTGPPSSGTTYMTNLLHHLGLDSGFDEDHFKNSEPLINRGKGLEFLTGTTRKQFHADRVAGKDNSPKLIKKPITPLQDEQDPEDKVLEGACTILDRIRAFGWSIDHIYVMIRNFNDFHEAAKRHDLLTRNRVRKKFLDRKDTERWVGLGFYNTIAEILDREIPYSIVLFPKVIRDCDYAYSVLAPIHRPSYGEFEQLHKDIGREDLVHYG